MYFYDDFTIFSLDKDWVISRNVDFEQEWNIFQF